MTWWRTGVVYQVYPRSYADGNRDGVGDIPGIRDRLDHLTWLGVDAVWLSPVYRSPMADFGYDVADHCDVEPIFGTLDDLDGLIADCHERGLRVLLDWVPNHTSDQHPWFTDPSKRDWYVWRPGAGPGRAPNGWEAAFGRPAWSPDPAGGDEWYLHLFTPQQPDLDWNNPAVEAAMHDVLRFWLDRGVDGFRADVVHLIGKDVSDRGMTERSCFDLAGSGSNHALLRRLRSLLDSYPGDRVIVGEVFLLDTSQVAAYYGDGDELHLSFNFCPSFARWDADEWHEHVRDVAELVEPVGWPTWVLGNHDLPRQHTRYGTEARARAAAFLTLGLRGTPFLYAGEELALADAEIADDERIDPGGREGCRAPLPWTRATDHGWGTPAWLPFPPNAAARSVEAQQEDEASALHLYRRLLAARRASPALLTGEQMVLPGPPGVLAWLRIEEDDRRVVLVNFTSDEQPVPLEGDWICELASDTPDPAPWRGVLGPDQAILLRPR